MYVPAPLHHLRQLKTQVGSRFFYFSLDSIASNGSDIETRETNTSTANIRKNKLLNVEPKLIMQFSSDKQSDV